MESPYIIAIDFDGCIATGAWPNIKKAKLITNTVKKMKRQLKDNPDTVFILWTCRTGEYLRDAIIFIREHDLPIHFYNQNHPSTYTWFSDPECRKIFANEYWDDRAVQVGNLTEFGGE